MLKDLPQLQKIAFELLFNLISTPSFSKEEDKTGDIIASTLESYSIPIQRIKNNVFAFNQDFRPELPTLLLNSHHDTVKPNSGYTRDPYAPIVENGKLYGLGSNDAGGALVSLMATFLYFYNDQNLKYNICYLASAEEEISGINGIELFLKEIKSFIDLGSHKQDCAIIGEPTLMNMAIAEKGLLVLDALARGKAGHAAREEGINALYLAMDDIQWIKNHRFEKVSPFLGPVKMTVTSLETPNKAHNVVPDTCQFLIDIRVNECYTFEEILDIIAHHTHSEIAPRSLRLRSSLIPEDHPLVQAGLSINKSVYGSPTTSDKALVGIPALKMGPGDSARSHTADEYIYINEINSGIVDYISTISKVII